MKDELYGAAFDGRPVNVGAADALILSAKGLLATASAIV